MLHSRVPGYSACYLSPSVPSIYGTQLTLVPLVATSVSLHAGLSIDLVLAVRSGRGAWNRLRGMEPVEAMKSYLLKVTELCPDWLAEAQGRPPGDAGTVTQEDMKKDLKWEGSDKEEDKNGAGLGFGVTVSTMAAGQG